MNQERTPPTKEALASALTLSEEILKNIEHSEIPLTNIALKTSRLARLLNEPMYQKMMEYEAGGYPATPDKAPRQEIWDTAIRAGRRYTKKDKTSGEVKEFVYRESIAELEDELRIGESSLAAAHDPDISIASSNPHQFVSPPSGNIMERNYMRQMIWTASQRLSSRRALIYNYVLQKYHQLKFSTITADIFTKIRYTVDSSLSKITPKSAIEFPLVYEKMKSDNPEDWVGCVFICRKIFHELANKLYPTRKDDKVIKIAGTEKTIKLGKDDYINRLVAFVEENSKQYNRSHRDRFRTEVSL